jgi:phosphoserine phosphatase
VGTIYLIRHGETDWNREGRLQGITDVPLNRVGLVQTRALSRHLKFAGVRYVVASPLRRARHSAHIVSDRSGWPLIVHDDLREIDHGIWTGLTVRELATRFPRAFECWQLEPRKLRLRGAESLHEAYARASRILSQITRLALKADIAVISHGVIMSLMMCAAAGYSPDRLWDFPQPNACLRIFRTSRGGINGLESRNDAGFRLSA